MYPNRWSKTLYVQIRANAVLVRDLERKTERRVIAEKPFSTQRLLIGEFYEAEAALKQALATSWQERWSRAAPVMLMHALEKSEGGLSGVERRVLAELALGQGPRRVALIRPGPVLDDATALGVARDLVASKIARGQVDKLWG